MVAMPMDGTGTEPDLVGARYELRPWPTRLPIRLHPDMAEIVRRNDKWKRTYFPALITDPEEMEFYVSERISVWASGVFPSAPLRRVVAVSDWTAQWLLIDDYIAWRKDFHGDVRKARRTGQELIGLLHGERPDPDDPMHLPFQLSWNRLMEDTHPEVVQCARDAICRYIDFIFGTETQVQPDYDRMTADEYMALAHYHVGTHPWIQQAEVALEISIGHELRESPQMARVWESVGECTRLVEDAFSFRKEFFSGDRGNLVLVLMRNYGLGLQEALDEVHELYRKAEERLFRRIEAVLSGPAGGRQDVRAYLDEIPMEITGMLHYGHYSPRYNGAGFRWNGRTTGVCTIWPDRTEFPSGRGEP
ncbi:hypothetical protein CTZ27_32025 [Streptomyces griseocarneus]|nr:hypothetical protein CTZ27_32025 [Streptomyces griseocarneus]